MIRRTSCPVCHKTLPATGEAIPVTFPFCSDRCRKIDLARWSDGRYAIVEDLDPARLALEIDAEQQARQDHQ